MTIGPDEPGYATLCEFDRAINAALDEIAILKRNWDAEDAFPVTPSIIQAARDLVSSLPGAIKKDPLAVPSVVPMRKGNLQFEWHDGPRTLELEIESVSTIHYLKFHPEAGIEEEDICPIADTQTLTGLIQWFVEG